MRSLALIATLVVALAACGTDDTATPNNTTGEDNIRTANDNSMSPNNGSSNSTTSANNTSSNNVSSNNTSNNVSPNNTGGPNNGSGASRTEAEPNDDRAGANMVALGDTISGTAEPGGEDVFAFSGAGTILELEILSAEPTLDVSLFVEPSTGDVGDRVIDLRAGSKRQFFLPEDNTWYISMRSFEVEDRDYEFVIREVLPMLLTDTFSAPVVGNLNDRAVDVYRLPDADGRVDASLQAERLPDGSDLDSIMFVYNPFEGLVTLNDDAAETTDSEVDFTATAGGSYWLVIDGWRMGSNNPYELTVTLP